MPYVETTAWKKLCDKIYTYGRLEHLENCRHYAQVLVFSRGGSAKKHRERADLAQPHVPGLDDRNIHVCGVSLDCRL